MGEIMNYAEEFMFGTSWYVALFWFGCLLFVIAFPFQVHESYIRML